MDKLVSIVVPVYNAEKFLSKAIESVLEQTYSEFELILVNDGSKDNSLAVCDKYAKVDSRIRVVSQENKGAGAARNVGIAQARGKYLMFLDADDTYEPEMVHELLSTIEQTGSDMVVCGYNSIDENESNIQLAEIGKKLYGQDVFDSVKYLCEKRVFNSLWNKIFLTEIVHGYGLKIDESLIVGEDFRFVLEYVDKCQSISFVGRPLYNYFTQNSFTTRRYRACDFDCRKKNVEYYISFCERHCLQSNCYFQYIKLLYSTCMQMSDKSCGLSGKQKKDAIYDILSSDEMNNAFEKAYAEDRYSAILIRVAKTRNVSVIMLFSKIINFVRKRKNVRWNRVSI